MNPTQIAENKVLPILKELEAAQLWKKRHASSSKGTAAHPAAVATAEHETLSSADEALIAEFVEAWGVSWYKLVMDARKPGPQRNIPNHALVCSEDDRSWRDARTGQGGDVFDLHSYLFTSPLAYMEELREQAKDLLEGGLDVRPGAKKNTEDGFVHPDFPTGSLPEVLRNMVEAMSAVEKLSPILSALCCMAASSAALGNKLWMDSINDWNLCGNLYMTACAKTGTGKSRAGKRAFGPIYEFEQKLQACAVRLPVEQQKARLDEIAKELARMDVTSEEHLKLCEEQDRLQKPRTDKLTTLDATSEALAQQMAANGSSAAILGSEARSAVDMIFGRYRNAGQTDENLYLQAYSVEPFNQARISRGNISIADPCLTMLLLLQPDKFGLLVGKQILIESGFLCRFLMCDTRATTPGTAAYGVRFPSSVMARYTAVLTELLNTYRMAQGEPLQVEMTRDAWESMRVYREHTEDRKLVDLEECMHELTSRWGENAYRMALVFHAVEHGARAHLEKVSKETADKAINVVSWFAHEQTKLIREAADRGKGVLRAKIIAHIKSQSQATARDIGRSLSAARPLVDEILEELIYVGVLKTQPRTGSGRNTLMYLINVGNKK